MLLPDRTMKITKFVSRFLSEDDGPTAVEYAIMLALIFGVIVATVGTVGSETNSLYTNMSEDVETAVTGAAGS